MICTDIWISATIICLRTQLIEIQGPAMNYLVLGLILLLLSRPFTLFC